MSEPTIDILLIDDDDINNYLTEEILNLYIPNVSITSLNKVEKAVTKLEDSYYKEQKLPDVIFLDINMPKLDGWDFLKLIERVIPEEKLKAIKIYIYTSSVFYEDINRARAHKFVTDIFTKPLTKESVIKILLK